MWCSPTFDLLPCLGQHSARSFLCLSACLSVCLSVSPPPSSQFLRLPLFSFSLFPLADRTCLLSSRPFLRMDSHCICCFDFEIGSGARTPSCSHRQKNNLFFFHPATYPPSSIPPSLPRPFTRSPTIPIRIDGKSGAGRTNNKTQATKKKGADPSSTPS